MLTQSIGQNIVENERNNYDERVHLGFLLLSQHSLSNLDHELIKRTYKLMNIVTIVLKRYSS